MLGTKDEKLHEKTMWIKHAMKVMLDKHIPDYVSVNAVMNVEDDIEIRDFR